MSNDRFKQHTPYYNKAGKRVPGTTTISGILDKRFLVKWANQMGLKGIDTEKYVDEKAKAGSLAHAMILCHVEGTKPDLKEYTGYEVDQAKNSFLKYLEWEKRHVIEHILSEKQLISEMFQFGGTIDRYCKVDGRLTLLDFKTCKAIYDEHWLQVGGGYGILLDENEMPYQEVRILQIGRDENEGFSEQYRSWDDLATEREIFKLCRQIYELQKKLNRRA
jgi:hypothetical protein